ncbi:hypothetical protein C3L33_05715, partial [Rhododendron williamsianum]
MRIDGTTKSSVASHLAEFVAGAVTIRAFGEEDQFFLENFQLIDVNPSSSLHKFSANEWLFQCLEILCAIVLSCSALVITFLSNDASKSGFIGMAPSYGLSLNTFHSPELAGICDVLYKEQNGVEQVRYQPNSPLVLRGISCVFEGGDKIGLLGRTGSGKTTLINALFRHVEPTEGSIIVDGTNISTLGLHDLRSHFGFHKIQLSLAVVQDGSNWSMGQRQLFCLGQVLQKRRKILVLDEATASTDNAKDSVIQKIMRMEFADCTVITVAHRIPAMMDSTMVLSISDSERVFIF